MFAFLIEKRTKTIGFFFYLHSYYHPNPLCQELMQNADDAGAKVVKFLVDERENRKWRTGLLTSALADLQGPALWVFNDAQFSDKDFENLCKLGGATKKEDCSKVCGLRLSVCYCLSLLLLIGPCFVCQCRQLGSVTDVVNASLSA